MTERARMNEQQFSDIAAACDRLLRAPDTSLARLAIPALHFLNEHPGSLAQYSSVLTERSDGRFSSVPKAVIRAARGLTRSLAVPRLAAHQQSPIDVVIVSHLLQPEQLHQGNDFYFGALQGQLQDQGATSLLVLISHLTAAGGDRDTQPLPYPRMMLPGTVSPAAEADIWRQCMGAWRALRREAAGARNSVDRRLAMLASRQVLSAATVINLRMHAGVVNICRAVNPKIVITTYEGTVAERLIWHAARTARRRPLCVGYQHAMVLERAHAIRRPVAAPGIDCDPDVILTLGEIPHAALAASPGLQSVRFIEYGSHRRATLPALPQPQHRPRRCLVLPDASDRECTILFDFALDCARRSPDINFALRPHPMVDTRSLLRRHPYCKSYRRMYRCRSTSRWSGNSRRHATASTVVRLRQCTQCGPASNHTTSRDPASCRSTASLSWRTGARRLLRRRSCSIACALPTNSQTPPPPVAPRVSANVMSRRSGLRHSASCSQW